MLPWLLLRWLIVMLAECAPPGLLLLLGVVDVDVLCQRGLCREHGVAAAAFKCKVRLLVAGQLLGPRHPRLAVAAAQERTLLRPGQNCRDGQEVVHEVAAKQLFKLIHTVHGND